MRISELKEKRIIHRPTRNFDRFGNRIYHEFEYESPYNPSYKGNERERLFAKVIDLLPFFLIFLFVFQKNAIVSFLLSVPCVIIFGTIIEFYWGTTLGKKIFKIRVLDDNGKFPTFFKSLQRNFLCLANLWPIFTDYVPPPNSVIGKSGIHMNFSMNLNNKICKTYMVKASKISEIKKLLEADLNKKSLSI